MSLWGLASLPIARATLRERGPAFLPGAMAVLLSLVAVLNAAQSGRGEDVFAGAFARLFVVGLTMALGAGLIADEIDSGHAQLVLLRPITRAEWFGGRLLGAGAALVAAVLVAWSFAGLTLLWRFRKLDLAWLAAPLCTSIEGLAWLSVLAMLSVRLSRWMNVGAILLATIVFAFSFVAVPFILREPRAIDFMRALGSYLGPQQMSGLLRALRMHSRVDVEPLFYDLMWLFGSWLAGCLLLNGREIARRQQ